MTYKSFALIFCCFFHIVYSDTANANGGPIDAGASVRTGFPQFLKIKSASINNEKLSIIINGDYAHVSVTYSIEAIESDSIIYGFPIDFQDISHLLEEPSTDGRDTIKALNICFRKDKELLNNLSRYDLGFNSVSAPLHMTTLDAGREWVIAGNSLCNRIWYFTKMNFLKGEKFDLTVEYDYRCSFQDWAFSKSYYAIYSERQFFYDFTAASNWAVNPSNKLTVDIDATSILQAGDSCSLQWMDFEKTNEFGIYHKEFSAFQFYNLPPLLFKYSVNNVKNSKIMSDLCVNNKILNSIENDKGSKDLKNILDANPLTFWMGYSKKRQAENIIVLQPIKNYFGALRLVKGNRTNSDEFYENGRLKKVLVEYFEIDSDNQNSVELVSSDTLTFSDKPFDELNEYNLYANSEDVVVSHHFYHGNSCAITITILEIYEGTKNKGACFSDLYFLGW